MIMHTFGLKNFVALQFLMHLIIGSMMLVDYYFGQHTTITPYVPYVLYGLFLMSSIHSGTHLHKNRATYANMIDEKFFSLKGSIYEKFAYTFVIMSTVWVPVHFLFWPTERFDVFMGFVAFCVSYAMIIDLMAIRWLR
ncbi:hypothetical protein SAMN03159496_05192 [Rhizobium sp. NFR07]|uniref:hypothetical protein n=1 Tax=Rhizobium sp. NFR07 TaxID=1566262 RepID=UPI0008F2B058|nr:hypothetical protein [Rhizobium sp. NFR07]SFB56844.1 hypothetical protein SAMN03159496_05192 [Rhizobium sp. NFR07]